MPRTRFYKNSTAIASIILFFMGLVMLMSIREDSITTDEAPHITSGYSYLKLKDMRLNPEHPPLIKDFAAIPLLFLDLNFPKDHPAWTSMVNAQWDLAPQFLYRSGNDPDKIIFWGRMSPILITLLFGWFVFKWARELYGAKWATLALALFAFSPTILAHGRLVTTDVPAAAAFFISIYYFIKLLKNPTKKNLIIAGVVFAIAQLTKFSLVLLLGFLPGITVVWLIARKLGITPERVASPAFAKASAGRPPRAELSLSETERGARPRAGLAGAGEESEEIIPNLLTDTYKWILRFVVIFAITALIILPIYQFHVLNYPPEKQIEDIQHILNNNTKFPVLTDSLVWMSDKPILRAYAQYMLGVSMVFMRVAGGNTTYFLGEVSNQAWLHYFPVAFLIKEPLALIIFIALGLILALKNLFLRFRKARLNLGFDEITMLLFVIFYWAISITGNLNIGVRHVLPTFPFIYLLIAGQMKRWLEPRASALGMSFPSRITVLDKLQRESRTLHEWIPAFAGMTKGYFILVILLLAFYIISSLAVYPHFIAYFNEFAGGPNGGHRYVVDSNLDWGQDLRRLKKFVEKNSIDKIKVDYFGGGDVKYYLGDKAEAWHADNGPTAGWIAVSATFLQTSRAYPWASYEWLDKYTPFEKIGYSIFVYNIGDEY